MAQCVHGVNIGNHCAQCAAETAKRLPYIPARNPQEEIRQLKNTIDALNEDRYTLRAKLAEMRAALSFAVSVIKSGEPWTETCERTLGDALKE